MCFTCGCVLSLLLIPARQDELGRTHLSEMLRRLKPDTGICTDDYDGLTREVYRENRSESRPLIAYEGSERELSHG